VIIFEISSTVSAVKCADKNPPTSTSRTSPARGDAGEKQDVVFREAYTSMQEAKPVVSFCIMLSPSDSYGSNSSNEASDGWSENGFPVEPYEKPFQIYSDRTDQIATAN